MPNGHKYTVNGEEKPGVTSILSILNKPGLPQWAANQAIEAIKSDSKLVYSDNGKYYHVYEKTLYMARKAFTLRRDDSANIGKNVHKWIENHVKNKLEGKDQDEEYSEDMKPSIESFLSWEEKYQPEYLFSERIIYSEQGDYCGTCDVGVKIDGKRIVLDFKTGKPEKEYNKKLRRYTGKKRAYSSVFIQDALYDLAIEEEEGIRADQYGALYLSTNGELLFALTDDTDAYRKAGQAIVETFKSLNVINQLNQFK